MRFEDTGLPNTEKVKKAFDFSWGRYEPMFKKTFDAQINQFETSANTQLRQLLARPGMADAEKKSLTEQFNQQVNLQKRNMQQAYPRSLETSFVAGPLAPPVAIASLVPNANDNLIAAALLVETIRSPEDMAEVKQTFDESLVKLVTEYRNLELHKAEILTNLPKASEDAKRLYLSVIISDLSDIVRMGNSLRPGQYLETMGGPDQLKNFVKLASSIRGNDLKMDGAFVKVFNEANKYLVEGFELKKSDTGTGYSIKPLPKVQPKKPGAAPGAKAGGAFNNNAGRGRDVYGKIPATPNNQPRFFINVNRQGPHYGVRPPNVFRF